VPITCIIGIVWNLIDAARQPDVIDHHICPLRSAHEGELPEE